MFENIKKICIQRKKERTKDKNFKFGEEWEEEVREVFFVAPWYDLLEKTHDYSQNKKDYVKSSQNPDYKFLCKTTKRPFYIECKARNITDLLKKSKESLDESERLEKLDKKQYLEHENTTKYLQLMDICSKEQFLRFKQLNLETKVLFMVLLTSDHTYRDDVYSLIPIDDLLSNKVYYSQFLLYQIANSEIEPTKLWRNFLLFYGYQAFCIRCHKEIKYNNFNPFCYDCWANWYTNGKFNYEEKFCHSCGKEHRTTSIKPLCFDCYQHFPNNVGL